MPIYEYICQNCGATFDQLRSFSQADDPIACPQCAQSQSKRKLSSFFAHNESGNSAHSSHNCGSCSGGSCSTCH
ncbi:MAG TPA: FmdB family transcriptional regulator [Anaerolineaceae bacterium]|nr:FmdB family transcriptional regulator [Anaerolineaceae bacterium]